jgi:hypothetical protein
MYAYENALWTERENLIQSAPNGEPLLSVEQEDGRAVIQCRYVAGSLLAHTDITSTAFMGAQTAGRYL